LQRVSLLYPQQHDSALATEAEMLDLMFIAIGIAFLAGAMLYAMACERM
jgi:hypothetical protein